MSKAAMLAACLTASVMTACASDPPVDASKLAAAPAWAMHDCGNLEPIPPGDGDPNVRQKHYGATRSQFADCRDRHRALVARERVLSKF